MLISHIFLVGILELPSVDGRGTLLDPLEHPPDEAEVGADLRAAATSRQEAPTGMYWIIIYYTSWCNMTKFNVLHNCS